MIHLIRADLRRILRKRSFLFVAFVTILLSTGNALWNRRLLWSGFSYAVGQTPILRNGSVLLLGLAVFSAVYSDEFRARSMQAAIGRGVPRRRIILAKAVDCIVLSVLLYGVYLLFLLLLGQLLGAHMNGEEVRILVLSACLGAYTLICCAPLAAVFLYMTDNSALAVFMLVLITAVIPAVLGMINSFVLIHNLHLPHYYITGFADRAYADMMLGGGGGGTLLAGAALYLGLALLLSFLIYRRKELDF